MGITEEDVFDFLLLSIFAAPFVILIVAIVLKKEREKITNEKSNIIAEDCCAHPSITWRVVSRNPCKPMKSYSS